MKISAFWAKCDNFGDKLTKSILETIEGVEIYFDTPKYAKICGAGSILNRFIGPSVRGYSYPLYVFGAGFNHRRTISGGFMRELKVYAVRGQYSKMFIEDNIGKRLSDSVVLGDLGLLSDRLLPSFEIKKKYNLGIVPHYVDYGDPRFIEMRDRIPNSIIISTHTDPRYFVQQLMQCKCVISTAMHPLIACDALRIPNIWAFLPNANQVDMSFKFNDYYSAFDIQKDAFVLDNNGLNSNVIKLIKETYDITDTMIYNKKRELNNSLLKMIRDIKSDVGKDIIWRAISKSNSKLDTIISQRNNIMKK